MHYFQVTTEKLSEPSLWPEWAQPLIKAGRLRDDSYWDEGYIQVVTPIRGHILSAMRAYPTDYIVLFDDRLNVFTESLGEHFTEMRAM